MTPLERLVEIQAISDLKARYTLYLDSHDYGRYRELFTQDALLIVDTAVSTLGRAGECICVAGRDEIVDFVIKGVEGKDIVHQCHTPIIELLSEATARGVWSLQHTEGASFYREDYRKIHGEWQISSLHLSRVRFDVGDIDRG